MKIAVAGTGYVGLVTAYVWQSMAIWSHVWTWMRKKLS